MKQKKGGDLVNRTPVSEREAMCDYISAVGVCQAPGINEISGLLFCGEHWARVMDMPGAIRCSLLDAFEREKMLKETGSLGRFCEEVVVDGMAKDLEVNL